VAFALNGRSQTCAPVTSGLVDWWPGNGNANDVVGTNNGTIPDPTNVTFGAGEVGQAFIFSGSNPGDNVPGNEVDFGTNAGNFGTNDFTIDFWIKIPSNAPDVYAVLGKYAACNASMNFWHLRIGPVYWTEPPLPGQLAFAIGNSGQVLCQLRSSNTINDGIFHHIALIRHGVTYSFYIDGSFDNSATASGMADINNQAMMRAGDSVCVPPGVGGSDNTLPLAGELDELDLWGRALTPAEIDAIYQAGSAGKCPIPSCAPVTSGLVDWWPGDGNANDIVGAANGTIPDTVDVTFGVGEVGQAFVFSGISPDNNDTGNEVDFGTNAGNFGTNDFTIDFWIKVPSNAPGQYGVLEKRLECNGDLNMWNIRIGPVDWTPQPLPGQVDFAICGDNQAFLCQLPSTKAINDGIFHHVALIRKGATYSYYIDGAADSSKTVSGIADINNTDMFRAGQTVCVGVEGNQPFVGELDALDLWGRALTPAEIYAIYQAGSAGKCGASSPLPIITSQPQSLVASAYENAAFSVTAASTPSYQWLLNGSPIAGATASSLDIPFVTQSNLGTYAVLVSNPAGSVMSSNATLSMYPYLESPFTGSVVTGGGNATLNVVVWGSGPLTYQWYDNGTAIADATTSTLALTNIQASNAGLYSVVVSSPLGSVTNIPAQVVVDVIGLYPGVTISGEVGYNYLIQSTTNVTDPGSWITITNITLTEGTQLWVDTNECISTPTNVRRFYRVSPGP
jgi:hypothetical protein